MIKLDFGITKYIRVFLKHTSEFYIGFFFKQTILLKLYALLNR